MSKKTTPDKAHTCGNAGGRIRSGTPCKHPTPDGERCKRHPRDPSAAAPVGGRPPVVFDEKTIKQIERLAAYLTQEQMADVLGIAKRTLATKFEEYPEARAAYERGVAKSIEKVASNLIKMSATNPAAAIFFLKARAGWSEKQRLEITNARMSLEDWLRGLTDTELRRLEAMGEDALLAEYDRACPPPDARP